MRGLDRRNDAEFEHTALIIWVNDLGMLDSETELLLLTLLEICDVRALQLQRDLERVNGKPICKILPPSALTFGGLSGASPYSDCMYVNLVSFSCPILGQRGKHSRVDQ